MYRAIFFVHRAPVSRLFAEAPSFFVPHQSHASLALPAREKLETHPENREAYDSTTKKGSFRHTLSTARSKFCADSPFVTKPLTPAFLAA